MNDNKKIKTKITKAFIAAATILAVVASATMFGIQTQMSQYALAKHAARDPVIPETLNQQLAGLYGYSGTMPTEPNAAPGCQVASCIYQIDYNYHLGIFGEEPIKNA